MTLDERYSENIEKVYKITIRFIIETVIQGYEMASDREANDNVAESKGGSESASGCPVSSDHQEVNNLIQNMKTSVASTASGNKIPAIEPAAATAVVVVTEEEKQPKIDS